MPALGVAARLEQEPSAAFRLVDPALNQARAGDIAMLVAEAMRLAQICCQLFVVLAQLRQHIERRDEFCVVIEYALQAPDMTDRT